MGENPTRRFSMENPFTFKVGQVFTGFGIGCGFGIGVGRPLNLGAIPVLQQVMSATRGATDAFSGVGGHVNSSLRRFGMKSIEAGIGCGVGIGHGFGIGLAVKPGVVHQIQSCLGQAMHQMMTKMGIVPDLSVGQSIMPGTVKNSVGLVNETFERTKQTPIGNITQFASNSACNTSQGLKGNDGLHIVPRPDFVASKGTPEIPISTRTEKVVSNFLQNPVLQDEKEMELNELARRLQSENNVLQILLSHQQIIGELKEENAKLRKLLVDDLRVSPTKLSGSIESWECAVCLGCRRKQRRSRRL